MKSKHISESAYKHLEKYTLQEYIQTLIDKHKIKIANGNFSVVLIPEDKPYVYKIWCDDEGFDAWIDYCIQNQGKYSFIPKIYGRIKKLPNVFIRNKIYKHSILKVAQIEKLSDCEDLIMTFNHIGFEPEQLPFYKLFAMVVRYTTDEINIIDIPTSLNDLLTYAPTIVKTLAEHESLNLDLNKIENYAKRSNGDVVLVDPFWHNDYNPEFTIPSMLDTNSLTPKAPTPPNKTKVVVGKKGIPYVGGNKATDDTLLIDWDAYVVSNYSLDLVKNIAYDNKKFRFFMYSIESDITNLNQPKYKNFVDLLSVSLSESLSQGHLVYTFFDMNFKSKIFPNFLTEMNLEQCKHLTTFIPILYKLPVCKELDEFLKKFDRVASKIPNTADTKFQKSFIKKTINNADLWLDYNPSELQINK